MAQRRPSYILIRPLDGDNEGFVAYAIGLDGCVVEGGTEEETLANLKAAIADWRPIEPAFAHAGRRRSFTPRIVATGPGSI